MHTVYVLKSEVAQKSYVGMTNNLDRRILEHNSGKQAYTKRYKPWKVVYFEKYDTLNEASQREKYLKTRAGRRFLKKVFAGLSA